MCHVQLLHQDRRCAAEKAPATQKVDKSRQLSEYRNRKEKKNRKKTNKQTKKEVGLFLFWRHEGLVGWFARERDEKFKSRCKAKSPMLIGKGKRSQSAQYQMERMCMYKHTQTDTHTLSGDDSVPLSVDFCLSLFK
jgi:hypothetical protein